MFPVNYVVVVVVLLWPLCYLICSIFESHSVNVTVLYVWQQSLTPVIFASGCEKETESGGAWEGSTPITFWNVSKELLEIL